MLPYCPKCNWTMELRDFHDRYATRFWRCRNRECQTRVPYLPASPNSANKKPRVKGNYGSDGKPTTQSAGSQEPASGCCATSKTK